MRRHCFLLAGSLLLASCASVGSNTPEQRNEALVRRLFEAIRVGDLATLNAIVDPDGMVHGASGASHKAGGPHSDLKSACPICASLDSREIAIDLLLADAEFVTVHSTVRGFQVGELLGVPPTGKPIVVSYINVYRVRGRRIVENWVGSDRLGLAQQLGMRLCPP